MSRELAMPRLVVLGAIALMLAILPLPTLWDDVDGARRVILAIVSGTVAIGAALGLRVRFKEGLDEHPSRFAEPEEDGEQWIFGAPAIPLDSVDLRNARLARVNLVSADLSRALLDDAGLQGADLRRADLRSARLQGADLAAADLTDARLEGATYDERTIWPASVRPADRGAIDVGKRT